MRRRATSWHLLVLTCGRKATPRRCTWRRMRSMLRSMRASSSSSAGVSRLVRGWLISMAFLRRALQHAARPRAARAALAPDDGAVDDHGVDAARGGDRLLVGRRLVHG